MAGDGRGSPNHEGNRSIYIENQCSIVGKPLLGEGKRGTSKPLTARDPGGA